MAKKYSVHEVLSILEAEDFFTRADIFITPPLDPNCSDEDSGDEDGGVQGFNNLTRRQLEAEAEVSIHSGTERRTLGLNDVMDLPVPCKLPAAATNSVGKRIRKPSLRKQESSSAASNSRKLPKVPSPLACKEHGRIPEP